MEAAIAGESPGLGHCSRAGLSCEEWPPAKGPESGPPPSSSTKPTFPEFTDGDSSWSLPLKGRAESHGGEGNLGS